MSSLVGVFAVVALVWGAPVATNAEEQEWTGLDLSRIAAPRFTFSFNNHTYEISNFNENWQKAKYYCKALGLELVTIESEEEQMAINENISAFDYWFWTSLNDLYQESTYFWESTGALVGPYTNWAAGEPTRDVDENCMYLNRGSQTWSMATCNSVVRYICESR